jgi:hypothetical protein
MWQFFLNHQVETIAILSLIIIGFSVGIYKLSTKLTKTQNAIKALEEKKLEKQKGLRESIRIISMATIQGQCETSEACLRLGNLLPLYQDIDPKEDQWQDLFSMFQEIRGLKTMSDRADLKASARHREDQIRYAAEEKYHKRILGVCQKLYDLTKDEQ